MRSITSGKHFSVRGPLNVPRTPQGHPVIVQAGGSEDMIEVAARIRRGDLLRAADDRKPPRSTLPR